MTLRELRKSRGLTLADVALGMGCCISAVSKHETNTITMTPTMKERFCLFYNVKNFDHPISVERILKKAVKALAQENKELKETNKNLERKLNKKRKMSYTAKKFIEMIFEKEEE